MAEVSGAGYVEPIGALEGVGGLEGVADRVAEAVDNLLPVSDEAHDRVLVDETRLVRWTVPLFAGCTVVLVPWIVFLGATLPQRQVSHHYAAAWTGYDVILMVGLALTAYWGLRRSRLLPVAASGTGALLCADAWFDVLTSPGGWSLAESLAMCLLIELPLAAVCFWLAVRSQDIAEKRLVMLSRRRRPR